MINTGRIDAYDMSPIEENVEKYCAKLLKKDKQ